MNTAFKCYANKLHSSVLLLVQSPVELRKSPLHWRRLMKRLPRSRDLEVRQLSRLQRYASKFVIADALQSVRFSLVCYFESPKSVPVISRHWCMINQNQILIFSVKNSAAIQTKRVNDQNSLLTTNKEISFICPLVSPLSESLNHWYWLIFSTLLTTLLFK